MNGSQRQTHKEALQAFPDPAPGENLKKTLTKDTMDEMDILEASTITEEIDMEDLVTEDHSSPEDPLVNLTKAPVPNVPESQVGQLIKTKVDVSNVRNLDISKMNAQPINPHEKKAQDQRSLKITHIPTQAQTFNSKCKLIV